jgi:hypothetical protein
MNDLANIPELDADAVPDLAQGLRELGRPAMENKDRAPLPPEADPRHAQRIARRRLVELTQGQSAARVLAALPGPGEAVHVRMDGSYNGYDFLPALLELLAPETIAELYIASLSFNRRVAERLLAAIDAHQVGRCVFLSSSMFQGRERYLNDWTRDQLAARPGSRLVVARSHCKLLLAATTDGRHIVMEGSQNLRTCACYEQATFTDDRTLYAWHRDFIERLGAAA